MKICGYCGTNNPDEAFYCSGCAKSFDEAGLAALPAPEKLTRAGFWIRVLARVIDAVFGIFIGLMAGVILEVILNVFMMIGALPPGWQFRLHQFSLVAILIGLIGDIMYHTFCEGIYGATIGKFCCGLRVVSEDGGPSRLKGAFIRSLAYMFDGLFFGLVGYHSMEKTALNQRYGDVWGEDCRAQNGRGQIRIRTVSLSSFHVPLFGYWRMGAF